MPPETRKKGKEAGHFRALTGQAPYRTKEQIREAKLQKEQEKMAKKQQKLDDAEAKQMNRQQGINRVAQAEKEQAAKDVVAAQKYPRRKLGQYLAVILIPLTL